MDGSRAGQSEFIMSASSDGQQGTSAKNFGVHTLNRLMESDQKCRVTGQKNRPDVSVLALGLDLNTLDLRLTGMDPLYPQLGTVWAKTPPDVNRINNDVYTPACYDIRPPHDLYKHVHRLEEPSLFYAFYGMPGDEMQLAAAGELYRRGWRYHMDSMVWFLPDAAQPPMVHERYQQGKFHYWDKAKWCRGVRDSMTLISDQLEGEPELPDFMKRAE
ncbi:NOT2 / NOT3 / NOT5 family [Carpediemonas membranifera]|uniref:NOT2 / NOT3 / NOT5 family n=1 Tax=Carpediemonas membranifera TaxID=201153 RepID=A0A8J6DYV3_9EUKA|nr:NOT2 / NOT3 / NOT5 family [Carpediemonas membranifera]|eukprot:KAG9392784.1 NOT2 / NOT3 / NOT5 family [Carpediemonas membranifera]